MDIPLTSWWTVGWFHFLALMNKVSVNIHVQILGWTYFTYIYMNGLYSFKYQIYLIYSIYSHFIFLGIYLGVEFPSHIITPCLTFWVTTKLFSKAVLPFTFPLVIYEGSSFSTSSPTLVTVFFIVAILLDVKWYVIAVLICISLVVNYFEHFSLAYLYTYLYGYLYIFFGEMSIQILCPFLIGLSFYYWIIKFLYRSGYKPLIRDRMCKYFLPFCGLSLHFLVGLIYSKIEKFKILMQSSLFLSFVSCAFGVISKKQIGRASCRERV